LCELAAITNCHSHHNQRRVWQTDIRVMILDEEHLIEISEGKLLLTKNSSKTLKKATYVVID